MIVDNDDALKRLASPMNLINQMRAGVKIKKSSSSSEAMKIFGVGLKETNGESKLSTQAAPVAVDSFPAIAAPVSFNPFPRLLDSVEAASRNEETDSSSPDLDDIISNNEAQIKLGLAHDSALKLLNDSVAMLSIKLEDVKADKLPAVISAASKTVESIRRERILSKTFEGEREVHYHFYTPQQRKIESYEVIDVQ